MLSLDNLIAFNEEILALVRAGVPLDEGLRMTADEMPREFRQVAERLRQRMERGAGLAEAVAAEGDELPPMYGAVVTAGVRSGRLAAALEGMTGTVRRLAEARRVTGYALIYPTVVLVLGSLLLWFMVQMLLPGLTAIDRIGETFPAWLSAVRPTAAVWGPMLPLLLLVVPLTWWVVSRRSSGLAGGGAWAWLPAVGRMNADGRAATFADVLALLAEYEVPLGEALRIAAAASGDARLVRASDEVASSVEGGQPLGAAIRQIEPAPPVLRRLTWTGDSSTRLAATARYAADWYRRRAEHRGDWLQIYLPMLMTLVAALAVAVALITIAGIPWARMLHRIAAPTFGP